MTAKASDVYTFKIVSSSISLKESGNRSTFKVHYLKNADMATLRFIGEFGTVKDSVEQVEILFGIVPGIKKVVYEGKDLYMTVKDRGDIARLNHIGSTDI